MMCNCSATDVCHNGKVGSQERCIIPTSHIKVEEYSDWIKVRDAATGKILHEGHSLAPFHWANILRGYSVNIDITYLEDDLDDEDETALEEAIDMANELLKGEK